MWATKATRGMAILTAVLAGLALASIACNPGTTTVITEPSLDGGDRGNLTVVALGPTSEVTITAGQSATPISWRIELRSQPGVVTVFLVSEQDGSTFNVDERTILPTDRGAESVKATAFIADLPIGSYRVRVRLVSEGETLESQAPGLIRIVPSGSSGNAPPTLDALAPQANITVSDGDSVSYRFTYRDPDSEPTVRVFFDLDRDPLNDPLGPSVLVAQETLSSASATTEVTLTEEIDSTRFPAAQDGAFYFVRFEIIDPNNADVRVFDYADGSITITLLVRQSDSPVDLGLFGNPRLSKFPRQRFTGTTLPGFAEGDLAGSFAIPAGDVDQDGRDDFVVVARFGNPASRRLRLPELGEAAGASGTAYLIFGNDVRLGGTNDLNSVGPLVRGQQFINGAANGTEGTIDNIIGPPLPSGDITGQTFETGEPITPNIGLVSRDTPSVGPDGTNYGHTPTFIDGLPYQSAGLTSAAVLDDLNGDGRPEFALGAPSQELFEATDLDPSDVDNLFYDGGSDFPTFQDTGFFTNTYLRDGSFWDNAEFLGFPIPDHTANYGAPNGVLGRYQYGDVSDPDPEDPTGYVTGGYVFVINGLTSFPAPVDLSVLGQRSTEITTDEGRFLGVNAGAGARIRQGLEFVDNNILTGPFGQWPKSFYARAIDINPSPQFRGEDYGAFLAAIPNFDTTGPGPGELLVSVAQGNMDAVLGPRGRVEVVFGADFSTLYDGANPSGGTSLTKSFPIIIAEELLTASVLFTDGTVLTDFAQRAFFDIPRIGLIGSNFGDQLGYALSGGDFNGDGSPEIACGAPGDDVNGLTDAGTVFIFAGTPTLGNVEGIEDHPALRIRGVNAGDRWGYVQGRAGDVNDDGIDDIFCASSFTNGNRGEIAILFGRERDSYIADIPVNAIGVNANYPGIRFRGEFAGDRAGVVVRAAGDFNGDGIDDFLIVAPGAERLIGTEQRRGLVYLIFGQRNYSDTTVFPREADGTVSLVNVGNSIPGIVFVSPYDINTLGDLTPDEAAPDFATGVGDIDGDGFDDIFIGNSRADTVDPFNLAARRINTGEGYLIYGSRAQ